MKAIEAAHQGHEGLAIRLDGYNNLVVLYSAKRNKMFIAKDHTGELWRDLDPAEAERYRDWEPAPKLPLRIALLNWLEKLWRRVF